MCSLYSHLINFFFFYLQRRLELIAVQTFTLILLVQFGYAGSVGQEIVVLRFVLRIQFDSRLEERVQEKLYIKKK